MGRIRETRATVAVLALTVLPAVAVSAADRPEFSVWLTEVRRDASARGVSAATLETALAGVSPEPRVQELDRRQPEFTLPLSRYLSRVVTERRVRDGRARLREHQGLLQAIGARYGVPPAVVVSLWGVETDYGRDTGSFPVIQALATLGYDSRRSGLFREELLDALAILDEGHVDLPAMRGSWAGAMGQSQFLPSSFRRYAVDHDGDGRRDIWSSEPDVLASIANYLARAGWRRDEPWAHRVRLPAGFDRTLAGLSIEKPPAAWRRLGLRRVDGEEFPDDLPASLVVSDGPAFLVYENLRVLLRWNRSVHFAVAAGQLADRIAAPGPAVRHIRAPGRHLDAR